MDALAAEVEESVDVVREALAARSCFSLLSLDTPVGHDGGEESTREVNDPQVEDDAARSEARLLVRPLLAGLAPRDRARSSRRARASPSLSVGCGVGSSLIRISLYQRFFLDK